jgi:hypothetical protein
LAPWGNLPKPRKKIIMNDCIVHEAHWVNKQFFAKIGNFSEAAPLPAENEMALLEEAFLPSPCRL